jgi:glycine hydroxymethyltransferase
VGTRGLTGLIAERALEECDIVINRCEITGSPGASSVSSDVRLGTNTLALRGMGPQEMKLCADLVDRVLSRTQKLPGHGYTLDSGVRAQVREEVSRLCERFPIPHYSTD